MENKRLADWMTERGMSVDALLEASSLERKVIDAILHGQYTPSPAQRQRAPPQLRAQFFAFQQLRHNVGQSIVCPDVMNGQNVRVIEHSNSLGFALEAAQAVGVL